MSSVSPSLLLCPALSFPHAVTELLTPAIPIPQFRHSSHKPKPIYQIHLHTTWKTEHCREFNYQYLVFPLGDVTVRSKDQLPRHFVSQSLTKLLLPTGLPADDMFYSPAVHNSNVFFPSFPS